MRAITLLIGFALLLCGCVSSVDSDDSQQLLAHRIVIPKEFNWGRGSRDNLSPAERYVYAYDQAWWACMEDFSKNIDYRSTVGDHAGNGWPAAIAGYSDGYTAAEKAIAKIRRQYGGPKAQALLKQALEDQS